MAHYVLADVKAGTYICCKRNHYLETYNVNEASEFTSIVAANNVLRNNVKEVNGDYKPVDRDTLNIDPLANLPKPKALEKESISISTKDYYNHNIEFPSYAIGQELPANLTYIINLFKDMADCVGNVTNSLDEYTDITKTADKATMDFVHFIEFADLSASEGYKTYKMLQNIRHERRDAKDMLSLLSILKDFDITADKLDKLLKVLNETFYERTYTPREVDLFAEFNKGE